MDAALAVEPPKRKAERPPKQTTNDEPESGERRSKRPRRSTAAAGGGKITPAKKSEREKRAEDRSTKTFDGVELPSPPRRRHVSSRASASIRDEQVGKVDDNMNGDQDEAEAGSGPEGLCIND